MNKLPIEDCTLPGTSPILRNTLIVVIAIALWKSYFAATLQLHPDEAYYWMWSRHLDFSYFDHAPLVAYMIRLTTLFSQQELWVRFGGILGALVGSILVWVLAMQLFRDGKIASAGVITMNTLPIVLSGSILVTPDTPAFFFTGLCIFLFWQIVETKKAIYWHLMGAAFGLSLLSKYTAVLLAPSLFLFMLCTDERRWFKTIHPYAAFVLGCAFFLPVLYWNSRHHWISFLYQTYHGLHAEHKPVLNNLLEYLGGQMLVAGPFIWAPGMYASIRSLFEKNKRTLFLAMTSLPIIVFFALSSAQRSAAANWPANAYFSFSILAAHYLLSGSHGKKRLYAFAIAFSVALSLIAALHARFNIIPLQKISPAVARADATNWMYGWKELAEELEKERSIKFAMTERNQAGPEISYYTRERIFVCVDYKRTPSNQYNYWPFPDELRDKNGVDVYLAEDERPPVENYFISTGSTTTFTASRDGFPIRTFNIVHGKGFKYPAPGDF